MTPRYIRSRPGRKDTATAAVASAVLAAGVGLVTFYLVRLLLTRDPAAEAPTVPEDAGPTGE